MLRNTPNGIRTRAAGVKGRSPRPLDDGGLAAEYRCSMTDIRPATEGDFDAVFDLLTARSRAAFGISSEQPAFLRQRWDAPCDGQLGRGRERHGRRLRSLDENQDFVHAAEGSRRRDALIAHLERDARRPRLPISRRSLPGRRAALRRSCSATATPSTARSSVCGARSTTKLPEPAWPDDVTVRSYTTRTPSGCTHCSTSSTQAGTRPMSDGATRAG